MELINNAKLSLEDRMVHRPWWGLQGGECGVEAWTVSVIHILFAGTGHSLRPKACDPWARKCGGTWASWCRSQHGGDGEGGEGGERSCR